MGRALRDHMQQPPGLLVRIALVGVSLGLVASPMVVGLSALGAPPTLALALVGGLCVAGTARWWTLLMRLAAPLVQARMWLVLWLLVALAASVQGARLGRFMLDPSRADDSVLPWRSFFREHSCLTAYTEAARLAPSGVNVYDPTVYQDPLSPSFRKARFIGPLEVDLFEYPPPFLLLPRSAVAAGLDFFTTRRILAMLAFARERPVVGGLALGFATLSKVFPGALGLLLIALGRWRAVAWTLAASLGLLVTALAVLGSGPFVDFFRYQLPRIHSGEAFFWIEIPSVALGNGSIYGLVTKLRLLGLPWTDKAVATAVCNVYMLALVPLAVLAAQRFRQADSAGLARDELRLRQAQTWLALLSLASFRSPFVPDAYATIGSLCLLTLVAAERGSMLRQGSLALAGLAFCLMLDDQALPSPVPLWSVCLTLATQLSLLGLNLWVVARPVQKIVAVAQPTSVSGNAACAQAAQ